MMELIRSNKKIFCCVINATGSWIITEVNKLEYQQYKIEMIF